MFFSLVLIFTNLLHLTLPSRIIIMNFEYPVDDFPTREEQLEAISKEYVKIIKSNSDAKLIIFPELIIPSNSTYKDFQLYSTNLSIPEHLCTDDRKSSIFIYPIACAIETTKVWVVMNILHKTPSGKYYPTDFLINAYGKIPLKVYRESQIGFSYIDHPPIPLQIPAYRSEIFPQKNVKLCVTSPQTGFRFSFGTMLSQEENVIHIVVSNWISQLPFLTSLQVYQMIAQEYNNITIIFSGVKNYDKGQGGAGVYHNGAEPVFMDYSVGSNGTQLYTYEMKSDQEPTETNTNITDIDELAKQMDKFKMESDPDLEKYSSSLLDTSKSHINKEVCYTKTDRFCCKFHLRIEYNEFIKGTTYTYHLVAYKNSKSYYNIFERGGVEVCGVVACLDSSLASCGKRFSDYDDVKWPITFQQIDIRANFSVESEDVALPIDPTSTSWTKVTHGKNTIERIFSLKEPQDRLFTFAIFGRNFTMKTNRSEVNSRVDILITLLIYVLCFLFR